jgi:hypothetical protein
VTGHCSPAAAFPSAATDPGSCAVSAAGRSCGGSWLLVAAPAFLAVRRRKAESRQGRSALAVAAFLLLGLLVRSAWAQAPSPPPPAASASPDTTNPPAAPAFSAGSRAPPASAVEEARAELRKGLALFQAGDPERALGFFLRSRAIFPAKGNTLDAAICLDRLARYDEALELYEEVVATFGTAFNDDERTSVPRAMTALRGRVGSLVVLANVDGAVVVDGRARGKLPLAAALRVMPGRHQVRVLKDQYATFEQYVEVQLGAPVSIDARLEPLQASGGLRVEDGTLPDALVLVDGVVLGAAPWEGHLSPGDHLVSTRKGNSGSAPTRASVLQGQTTLIRLSSSPLGPVRRLTVTPRTAELSLNGVALGKGRWEGPLPEGTYVLEASEEGYVARSTTFRQGVESGPTDEATSLALPVDEQSPRWPRKPSGRVVVGAIVGYGAGRSFAGDAESSCPGACAHDGAVNGLLVGARVAYAFPFRVGLEVAGGHLSLNNTVSRSVASGVLLGASPVTYSLHDLLRFNAYFFGGAVSYWAPIAPRWAIRSRITAGLLAAQVTDVLTGNAVASSGSAPLGITGAGTTLPSYPFFVMPELGVELAVGAVRLGIELGALFVPSTGPVYPLGPALVAPVCDPKNPVQIGCARDSPVLKNETSYRPFGVLFPQVTASYVL